jgi:hypothetical protein
VINYIFSLRLACCGERWRCRFLYSVLMPAILSNVIQRSKSPYLTSFVQHGQILNVASALIIFKYSLKQLICSNLPWNPQYWGISWFGKPATLNRLVTTDDLLILQLSRSHLVTGSVTLSLIYSAYSLQTWFKSAQAVVHVTCAAKLLSSNLGRWFFLVSLFPKQ